MRYEHPQFKSLVSAEYVLGLLIVPVKRRFERLMAHDPRLREEVSRWETWLTGITAELEPMQPPARVWRVIDARIELASQSESKSASRVWPAVAAALAVVSLSLGLLLMQPAPIAPADYIAVVNDEQGQPIWLVETTPNTGELRVQTIGDATPPDGRAHELWLLPAGDQAPISMGLLPKAGTLEATLPKLAQNEIPGASAIAVSLEPTGGSPTGAPTGPILYVVSLIQT